MKPPKPESERAIQQQIVLFLRERGWFVQVYSGSFQALPGLSGHPDILAMRVRSDGMLILLYIECKRKGGELRPSQEKWLKRAETILKADNVGYFKAEATEFDPWLSFYSIVIAANGWEE